VHVSYDGEADAAYIYVREPELRKGTVKTVSVQDAPGMIALDFDTEGCLFGIEVLDATPNKHHRPETWRPAHFGRS
jgi:uncharacterized protein YuzE